MGITIHYRFGFRNEKGLERTLTLAKKFAEKLGMKIAEFKFTKNKKVLKIIPHEKSEWIDLTFEKWKDIKERYKNSKEWNYQYAVLNSIKEINEFTKQVDDFISDEMWVCADFTKTQFAGAETHTKVCEVLRVVASFSSFVNIFDEGEYYETLDYENLEENIGALDEMIEGLTKALRELGFNAVSGKEL